jgi:hypothetical protein
MRVFSVFVSVLLAATTWAQAPAAVYTPSQRGLDVPTYVNATVVRADTRANTITFRSESGEVMLTAEGEALARLGRLRPGDEVLLGYRVDDRTGRPVQVVTAILSGDELADRGVLTAEISPSATSAANGTRTGRVVRVDQNTRTLTFTDESGSVESVSVQGNSALGTLGTLSAGDQVDVTFIPGATTGAGLVGAVGGIALANSPTFVTGEVLGVSNGDLRLRTAFGEQVFPVMGTTNLSSGRDFSQVRVGETVRLDLGSSGTRSVVTGLSTIQTGVVNGGTGRATTGRSTLGSGATASLPRSGAAAATTTASPAVSGRAGPVRSGGTVTTFRTPSAPGTVATGGGTVLPPAGTVSAPGTVVTGTGTVSSPGVVGGIPGTVGTAGVVPGTVGTVPGTPGVVGGVLPARVAGQSGPPAGTGATPLGSLTNPPAPVAGTTGLTNVGTAGTAETGFSTISQPTSAFASVIPSLPSTVGTLNVVAPPAAAPAMADQLPVGTMRDVATRDYDNAVRTLAMKANEIDMHWFRYRDGCLRQNSTDPEIDRNLFGAGRDREWFVLFDEGVRTPADDNCRQLRVEMNRMAMDWRDLMTRVEDTARSHDVLPGAMRDIRDRYRVEF